MDKKASLIKQWPINTRILCAYVHTCCLYVRMYLVRCTYILNVHTSGYLLFSQVIVVPPFSRVRGNGQIVP